MTMLFARRYMRSRKSLSVINIISRVSIFAVAIPVAAMVILLSVFNGFDSLVKGMYTAFDPDLLVLPAKGKVLDAAEFEAREPGGMPGVGAYSHILEESVMLEYRGRQTLATLRGVDPAYEHVVPIRSLMAMGEYRLSDGDVQQAVLGQGLAYNLTLRVNFNDPLRVYAPTRGQFSPMLPLAGLSGGTLVPGGVFALDADTDNSFVISSIDFARELLNYEGRSSGVAIKLAQGLKPESAKPKVQEHLGGGYDVKTRYEQKASMYKILKYEKWGIFFIIFLVLVIASFSIVGSLVMLIIDKRPDIDILITMGGDIPFVRRIFTDEGMLIGVAGTVTGIVIGMLVCLLQQRFGFVKLGGQTFLVDAYPVVMRWEDIAVITAATVAVNWIITKLTVSRMIPGSDIRL